MSRRRQKIVEVAECAHCRQPFIRKRPWQEYCKASCRTLAYLEREKLKAEFRPPTVAD